MTASDLVYAVAAPIDRVENAPGEARWNLHCRGDAR
jgi:hypothetical protein